MTPNDMETPTERETMARLLGLAGLGAAVPADREARVKRAVLGEARTVAAWRRRRRRALAGLVMLGAAAAIAVGVRFATPRDTPRPAIVTRATVERIQGTVRLTSIARDTASVVAVGTTLTDGDELETGEGRAGIRLAQGASLRFDRGSRARWVSAQRIALDAGAVYFDDGADRSGLEIQTPLGLVKDIGTQFEARILHDSLRVSVRSGVVEIREEGEVLSAHAGTQLTLGPAGRSTRTVLPYASEWKWIVALGPTFETNNQPLASFLEHLCREHGWRLTYATNALARRADGIVLHGSLGHLAAADALEVALSASGLTYRVERGELFVER